MNVNRSLRGFVCFLLLMLLSSVMTAPSPGTIRAQGGTAKPTATPTKGSGKGTRKIVFISLARIYTINTDGSDRRLIAGDIYYGSPVWSPDGQQIAAVGWKSFSSSSPNQIYVMNADGSNIRALTTGTSVGTNFYASYPAWSPDGKRIVFYGFDRATIGGSSLYMMNADGSDLHRLTDPKAYPVPGHPAWSPDGQQIAFEAHTEPYNIFVMSPDGSNVRRLTDGKANYSNPAWSPDGKRIALMSDRDGNYRIYVMNADGTNLVRLTSQWDWYCCPSWSPDGKQIAFVSRNATNTADTIYVVNANGTGLRRLTSPGLDPDWHPIRR